MKEKIIEMIKHYDQIDWNISCVGPSEYLEVLADQILALFISNPFWKDIDRNIPSLEGIEHVEKCDYCKDWTKISANCPYCHGTGEITRQAEWGDIDVRNNINECGFILDRVEKLKSQLGYVGEDWLEDITKAVLQMLTTKSGGRLKEKK